MTARERALQAAKVARARSRSCPIDDIEAIFRAHATEAVNLARQEWEAQQAESGFRAAAVDIGRACKHGVVLSFPCTTCQSNATPHPIDDEFLGP